MAFTVEKLLLTEERKTQLEEALANDDLTDPLAQCISEAEADVARLTAGYELEDAATEGWIRPIALWKAFVAAETPVPSDIQAAYDAAMKELEAIAKGERPNLPRTDDGEDPSANTGDWGSADKIS